MVRGHTCPGLESYQGRVNYRGEPSPGHTCIPVFDEVGHTIGCDETNYHAILFCPFCGVKLAEPKKEEWGV